jgi:drug/metabolite transporter (DMT)-like permease
MPVSPAERSFAVLLAVVGSLGAATAYSTIRVIGKRAHSLVSVNYFAVVATVGSFVIILVHPELKFQVPQTASQWYEAHSQRFISRRPPANHGNRGLLTAIGIAGFLLQFLLTEGLQREKAGRATNLIVCLPLLINAVVLANDTRKQKYTQLVFALILERVVWGTSPSGWSFIGAALIIGAAAWVSLQKNKVPAEQMRPSPVDEESSLLGNGAEGVSRRA